MQRDGMFHISIGWLAGMVILLLGLQALPAVGQALAPVAVAGPDIAAVVAVPVIIDGSKSHDPGGQLIEFLWTVAGAPAGSVAALAAHDPAPVFVPDLPGTYVLQLVVRNQDGTASPPSAMTLVAHANSPFPNARAGKDRRVAVGTRVVLDAGMSFDPLDRLLSYRWTLVSAPPASKVGDADIMLRDRARPWFIPDAPGTYVLRLEASNGERVAEDRVTVTAAAGNLAPVADSGWFQFIESSGPIVLDGTASVDPDAGPSPLALAWSLVARPGASTLAGQAIRDANTAVAAFTPDVDGAYVFRLTVSDGVASDADNVLVRRSTARAGDADAMAASNGAAGSAPLGGSAAARPDGRKHLANFALQVHPLVLNVAHGGRGAVTITLLAPASNAGAARLDVARLPQGVTATFGTQTLASGDSTLLTLRADATAPVGRHFLRITATAIASDMTATSSTPLQLNLTVADASATRPPACGTADLSRQKSFIYVAPGGSDSNSCGRTAAAPCATIHQGIDNCTHAGCGVLVRYGRYRTTSTISLKDGVSIFGSCHFGGAPAPDSTAARYRTVIEATPAPGRPALNGDGINQPTILSGLVIVGKEETATGIAGIASIVMVASHSQGIAMSNTSLVAGKGGNGINGRSFAGGPGGHGQNSSNGIDGGPGGQACAAAPTGGTGNGGPGGIWQDFTPYGCGLYYCGCTSIGDSTGKRGMDSGPVSGGGGGGFGGAGCGCAYVDGVPDGTHGTPGDAGSCSILGGTPGSLFGSFDGAKWIASVGGSGAPGAVGSGGGGGGGGGMAARVRYEETPLTWPGQPGGGGGGGGCGGPGGTGGGQGGASIALVLVGSTIAGIPEAISLVPGPGGAGGVGGTGGIGGVGGYGASGTPGHTTPMDKPAVCSAVVPGAGGAGGTGGRGGPGSGGAGGNGGPSIGIALVDAPNPGSASGIYAGLPGPGGRKGVGGYGEYRLNPCNGADGADGVAGGNAAVWQAKP